MFNNLYLIFLQSTAGVETTDSKIGTVIIVLSLIFAGIVAYMIYTERSLAKLEKEIKEDETK